MGEIPLYHFRDYGWSQTEPMDFGTQAALFESVGYGGTSLMRNSARLGPYSRTMPRALRWS